jgi:hypothetical protein
LILLYDQAKEPLGASNFNRMWHGPYIVWCVLEKGACKLEYYEGNMMDEPRNGIYLKRYYAWSLILGHELCILVYLSVYTSLSFPLRHKLAYQVFPWL